jgi:hypothetical protein
MSEQQGIEIIDSFINVARTIEKLPRLSLPEYQDAARDLAKICHKLLTATGMAVTWFNNFANFQFIRDPKMVIPEYNELIQKYDTLRVMGKFRKLDLSCAEISFISK